jgi:UDP-GlcNAc:undecaprenyl-phosphate GlcNAc-1-phosphate transferase
MNYFLIIILGLAFLVSFSITWLTIKFYTKMGWLDDPKKGKRANVVHQYPVPRGGGIPIFLTILLLSIFFLPLDKHLIGILIAGFILMITGIWDDIYNLSPYLRLPLVFMAALIVVGSGIGIPFISDPLHSGQIIHLNQPQIPVFLLGRLRTIWVLADLFAVFWIVGLMNFVNWAKGLDGQLPGIVGIASLVIAILSLKFSADITQWPVIILALLVSGAYFGFLPWNFYPQKIMPGYGGGTLGGYFLAVLSILSTAKVGTLMIVLAMPLIDAGWVMLSRISQGKMPVWGDNNHLHHHLLRAGWNKKQVAVFYWLITGVLGILALSLSPSQKLVTIIALTVLLGGLILWLKRSNSFSKPSDLDNG